MIQSHGQHVDENEAHNDHVEFLVGDDPKDNGLRFPLERERRKTRDEMTSSSVAIRMQTRDASITRLLHSRERSERRASSALLLIFQLFTQLVLELAQDKWEGKKSAKKKYQIME